MKREPGIWWRTVEALAPSPEQGTGQPGFAWCGNEFWEGVVEHLYPDVELIGVDMELKAKDGPFRRETGWTAEDIKAVPFKAFPEGEPLPGPGDAIAVRYEWFPNAVRLRASRIASRTQRKRIRRDAAEQLAFERSLAASVDHRGRGDARTVTASVAAPGLAEGPSGRKIEQDPYLRAHGERMAWLQRLIDPPLRGHNHIWHPEHYLAGMRLANPAHVNLRAFPLVGKSPYFPHPGPLIDERRFVLDDEAFPRDILDAAGITREQVSIVRLPYHDDRDAIYRLALPSALSRTGRPAGTTTGTLTRLWIPRFEGGSFCYVMAAWDRARR